MIKKSLLMGLMLALGALPMTMVNAVDSTDCGTPADIHATCGINPDGSHWISINGGTMDIGEPPIGSATHGCIWTGNYGGKEVKPCAADTGDTNGCADPDDIHYYEAAAVFIFLTDTCTDSIDGADEDFETGIGGANLPVITVPACRNVAGHHSVSFYVEDFVYDQLGGFRDIVSGSVGADGATGTAPCGDGIIDGNDPDDCFNDFWGKGPHTACGVGGDGSYWVFISVIPPIPPKWPAGAIIGHAIPGAVPVLLAATPGCIVTVAIADFMRVECWPPGPGSVCWNPAVVALSVGALGTDVRGVTNCLGQPLAVAQATAPGIAANANVGPGGWPLLCEADFFPFAPGPGAGLVICFDPPREGDAQSAGARVSKRLPS